MVVFDVELSVQGKQGKGEGGVLFGGRGQAGDGAKRIASLFAQLLCDVSTSGVGKQQASLTQRVHHVIVLSANSHL